MSSMPLVAAFLTRVYFSGQALLTTAPINSAPRASKNVAQRPMFRHVQKSFPPKRATNCSESTTISSMEK